VSLGTDWDFWASVFEGNGKLRIRFAALSFLKMELLCHASREFFFPASAVLNQHNDTCQRFSSAAFLPHTNATAPSYFV